MTSVCITGVLDLISISLSSSKLADALSLLPVFPSAVALVTVTALPMFLLALLPSLLAMAQVYREVPITLPRCSKASYTFLSFSTCQERLFTSFLSLTRVPSYVSLTAHHFLSISSCLLTFCEINSDFMLFKNDCTSSVTGCLTTLNLASIA